MRTFTTAAVLAVFLFGCGGDSESDEEKAKQVAEDYVTALAESDDARACELQTASSQKKGEGCDLLSEGLFVPTSPEVDSVDLNDDRANANVTGSDGSVVLNLVKEDDDWRVEEYFAGR
jgi:hypothetical protein